MAETRIFDARRGLTREALRELRRAEQVAIGIKDANTVVIGCWAWDAQAGDQASESFSAILIPIFNSMVWWKKRSSGSGHSLRLSGTPAGNGSSRRCVRTMPLRHTGVR